MIVVHSIDKLQYTRIILESQIVLFTQKQIICKLLFPKYQVHYISYS